MRFYIYFCMNAPIGKSALILNRMGCNLFVATNKLSLSSSNSSVFMVFGCQLLSKKEQFNRIAPFLRFGFINSFSDVNAILAAPNAVLVV